MCKINSNLTSDYSYNWKPKIFNNMVNHKFLRCNSKILRLYLMLKQEEEIKMIFEAKGFYVDLVEKKDLNDIIKVYNSNKHFLIAHMDTDKIKHEWLFKELESMKKVAFYSCKVVEKI